MIRRKLLWGLVAGLPLTIVGLWAGWQAPGKANAQAGTQASDCCRDPNCPPGCCPECPPDCCPPCP
jgi:hypothetical protein